MYTCPDKTYNRYWYDSVQENFDKHIRQMNQITRWNMESDAKEIAFKKMNEETMLYKVQDHVVANLMQACMAVTNTKYAKELQNMPMNYWPGDELAFAEDYGRGFDKQLEMESNIEP